MNEPILQASTVPGLYLLNVSALTDDQDALETEAEVVPLTTAQLKKLQTILAAVTL